MSLEKNIERIADALETIARAAEGNATAHKVPEMPQKGIQPVPPMTQQGSVPAPAQMAGGAIPVSLPAGQGMQWQGAGAAQQPAPSMIPQGNGQMPVQQPRAVQQPGGLGMVPTATASAKQYTFDQLAVATANLASSGKDVFTVLGRFGVSMLMDLPTEKYGEYAAALREAGAVI